MLDKGKNISEGDKLQDKQLGIRGIFEADSTQIDPNEQTMQFLYEKYGQKKKEVLKSTRRIFF